MSALIATQHVMLYCITHRYTSKDVLNAEKNSVFKTKWLVAGRADAVKSPGDYFTGLMCLMLSVISYAAQALMCDGHITVTGHALVC